jgi:isoleucyl-tRNA synthetase
MSIVIRIVGEQAQYYPLDSWFIKITEVRDRMFDLNETINWKPKSTGESFWKLENANDYLIHPGIPLPIWRTEDKQEEILIGRGVIQRNRKVNSGFKKENPFKGFEIGNMDEENYDLIDLHKM